VTHLRTMMLEELPRRNYSQTTVKAYLKIVESFAKHFHRPPDQLGPDQIRSYRVYLLKERKPGVRTVGHHTAALRFFFCKTFARGQQALPGHADLKPTSIYLHLSQRHLKAAGTPLDNAELSNLDRVKRSRRLHKK
jgi:site-specific recombinase XerD